ncbi:MAG: hypothetical protein LBQ62_06660 [Candidatus Accumulibacter sp.]|jgi:hypothetical protein|nr:hypothetical protein [Accumulibacter sp.]
MNFGKRMIGGLAIALFTMMSIPAVEADSWKKGSSEREQNRQNEYQPGRRGPGNGRGPHYRRHGERDVQQRPHRLSPEERSQLRRDIKDAGREIYPSRHR